jgi:signal transduction histidine kinase
MCIGRHDILWFAVAAVLCLLPQSSLSQRAASGMPSAKDGNKSSSYYDSLSDDINIYRQEAILYAARGDYKEAYGNMLTFSDLLNRKSTKKLNNMIARYSAMYDNQQILAEKNTFALRLLQYQVNQLRMQKKLILTDRDRKMLVIDNSKLQLRNKDLLLTNQRSEMLKQRVEAQRQHDKAVSLEKMRVFNKHLYMTWIVVLLLIVLFAAVYFIHRHLLAVKMKKEIKRANDAKHQAEVAREEVTQSDKMKSRFLQNVSHEIRTPLNAIVGFTDLLTDPLSELTDEDRRNFSKLINSNSDFLTTLVNDVLDLSKLESGNYKLKFSNVDLDDFCTQIVTSLLGTQNQGVEMRFVAPPEKVLLYTDDARVHQVIVNFLTNACKYTEKGSITLTYSCMKDNVIFSVTDTGCGIAPENAQKIFNRFEKLDSHRKGTGIGLNICLFIAERLHGEVKLDTSYTQGARFLFIHPLNLNHTDIQ